jgi:hypothetical protein
MVSSRVRPYGFSNRRFIGLSAQRYWVRTLEFVLQLSVVSNPDADHIGGFLDVFDAFP